MERTPGCLAKLDRMNRTLRHQEADRVPVSDFFWGAFLQRWREELGLAPDADIYRYYDLDWMVTVPNMDPHIRQFEILAVSQDEVVVRTGFEAVVRKKFHQAMPAFLRFETDTIDKLEAFEFDDAWDARRFFRAGDNQLAGVGDGNSQGDPFPAGQGLLQARTVKADYQLAVNLNHRHRHLARPLEKCFRRAPVAGDILFPKSHAPL